MTKEYKIATGWKLFILIGAPLLSGLFAWLAYTTLIADPFKLTTAVFILPLSIGMILMFIIGIIDMFKSKLIFSNEGIRKVNYLGEKKLKYDQIKGIKSDENYVYIIPKNENDKIIKVSQYFGKKPEWQGLFLNKFSNLDTDEEVKNEKTLYQDETYGKTLEERNANISHTKQTTKYINYLAWLISAWLWFYPHPYELATAAGIILPVFALFLVYKSKGLVKIIDVENSANPSLSTTLSVPPMAIMIRVLFDYNVLEYQNAWIYTVLAIPMILWVIIRGSNGDFQVKSKLEGIIIYPFLATIIGLFVFFASITINCTFDESTPEIYQSKVIKKDVNKSGRGATSYLLTLSQWGDIKTETEVGVSKSQFDRVQEGGLINVNLKSGLLSIPWIYTTTN